MNAVSPKLREDLELISGMDDHPLIFDPTTGIYHRVSRSGQLLLTYLDGSHTVDELAALVAPKRSIPVDVSDSERQLQAFVTKLDISGLLVGSVQPAPGANQRRAKSSSLMPRVIVSRSLPKVLEPIARPLRRSPLGILAALAGLLSIAGFLFGASTLYSTPRPDLHELGAAFVIAVAAQLLIVLIHECAHALVAQINGVPVRGLGFALLFYVMPVAFVDRTDAYRLRGRRGRIAIALAGMTSDGLFCGATGIVALTSDGLVHRTAMVLLTFQMIGLFVNLNPLMPGDGYTAVEAASGLVDPRGRSFALLRHLVLRRPLPSYLINLPKRARVGYLTYGAAAAIYIGFVMFVVVSGVVAGVDNAVTVANS